MASDIIISMLQLGHVDAGSEAWIVFSKNLYRRAASEDSLPDVYYCISVGCVS